VAPNERKSVTIPTLQTERLTLRGHRTGDFDFCFAMWSDPAVTRYIGGKPSTRQQSWMRMLTYIGHWSLLGFGYWAVEETSTGSFVGDLGFADYRRGAMPSLTGVPEMGWALAPAFHGRGYATEAGLAAIAWADAHFESPRTACLIDCENAPSMRLAEKFGYRTFERANYDGRPTFFLERVRA
jgi:RimJ/RimL family protein N-acetyltransferase